MPTSLTNDTSKFLYWTLSSIFSFPCCFFGRQHGNKDSYPYPYSGGISWKENHRMSAWERHWRSVGQSIHSTRRKLRSRQVINWCQSHGCHPSLLISLRLTDSSDFMGWLTLKEGDNSLHNIYAKVTTHLWSSDICHTQNTEIRAIRRKGTSSIIKKAATLLGKDPK